MICGQLHRAVPTTGRKESRRQWHTVTCSTPELSGGGSHKRRQQRPSGSNRGRIRWVYGAAVGFGSMGWAVSQFSSNGPLARFRFFLSASTEFDRVETNADFAPPDETSLPTTNGAKRISKDSSGPDLFLVSGAACIPHPDKAEKGGEDAFFIADDGLSVGVADGVGGWALSGVDAGEYARLLMKTAKVAAEKANDEDESKIPKYVLTEAHGKTTVPGSSTACILRLDRERACLHASNLGDSGFFVLRKDKVVFKSPPQQYQFNFPYQIGFDTNLNNTPDQAEDFCVNVQPGDIVVTGTDGLWDNVFVDECVRIVSACQRKGLAPSECSEKLAGYAQTRAFDGSCSTPFQLGARSNGYSYSGGGKPDDVTVIVSYVSQGKSKL